MKFSFKYLGYASWSRLARIASISKPVVCNLKEVKVVYPAGVVGLQIVAHQKNKKGEDFNIIVPDSSDVLTYLGRIEFFESLPESAEIVGDINHLKNHNRNPAHHFTELMYPSKSGYRETFNRVWDYLSDQHPNIFQPAFRACDEILSNINQHSNPTGGKQVGFVQLQRYDRNSVIELSFGDNGIGILDTLKMNPNLQTITNESEAIKEVITKRKSRYQDEERGGGLKFAKDQVVGKLGGRMRVYSYNGNAQFSKKGMKEINNFGISLKSFPGTILWIQIPIRF